MHKTRFKSPACAGLLLGFGVLLTPEAVVSQQGTPAEPIGPCIVVSEIEETAVLTNTVVALTLRSGERLQIHLENTCPQLKFHGKIAFSAEGGQLCVGRDSLISRSGESCRITSIEAPASTG